MGSIFRRLYTVQTSNPEFCTRRGEKLFPRRKKPRKSENVTAQSIGINEGRYFVGTPTDIDKVDAGGNNVTGEFTIYCTDPYKYDPTQTRATISGTGEGGGMIENSGMPVLPVLEAEATSDLGYVAFYCNGAEILVGDPAEQDYASRTENQELVSSVFSSGLDGWEKGTGILEDNADQSMSVSQDGTGVYLEA